MQLLVLRCSQGGASCGGEEGEKKIGTGKGGKIKRRKNVLTTNATADAAPLAMGSESGWVRRESR